MPPSFGFESSGPQTDSSRGRRPAPSRGPIPGLRGEEEERAEQRVRSPEQSSGRIAGHLPGQEPQAGLNASLHEVYGNSLVQAALSGIDGGPVQVVQGAMTLGAAGVLVADSASGLFSNSFVNGWLGQYGSGNGGGSSLGVAGLGVSGPSALTGEAVARHADAPGGGAWDRRSISKVETATRRGGRPISTELESKLGNAFGGVDFSQVRLHTDGAAVQAADAIHARAFTVGTDVYFNQGEFNPSSREGLHLIAHELTHVVQHQEGRLRPTGDRGEGMNVSRPTDATEIEAEARAATVVQSIGHGHSVDNDADTAPVTAPVTALGGSLASEGAVADATNGGLQGADLGGLDVDGPAVASAGLAVESGQQAGEGAVLARDVDADKDKTTHKLTPVAKDGTKPHEKLSDAVVEGFRKFADEVKKITGHDVSTGFGDTSRGLDYTTRKVGADNVSWHKTGRALDLNQDLPWLILKDAQKEEGGTERMMFRLYLPVKEEAKPNEQQGAGNGGDRTQAAPTGGTPGESDNSALMVTLTEDQLKTADTNPFGKGAGQKKFLDVTGLAAKFGWNRIPAHNGWEKSYNKKEWWHYENRGGKGWYEAIREIYTDDELVSAAKTFTGGSEHYKGRLKAEGVPDALLDRIFEAPKPAGRKKNRNAFGFLRRDARPDVARPTGKGQQLPSDLKKGFQGLFGGAIDKVRVHTDAASQAYAQGHKARAMTEGQDIFFGRGQAPSMGDPGKVKLLAEELHHAVEGGGGAGISQPGDAHEREAKGFAGEAVSALLGAAPGLGDALSQGADVAGELSGALGSVGELAGQVSETAGQLSGMGGTLGEIGSAVQGAAGQVQQVAGQAQGYAGQAQQALSNPAEAVSRLAGSEEAPAIADRMSQRFGNSEEGGATGGASGESSVEGSSAASTGSTASSTSTTSTDGGGGGGGSTSTASSTSSAGSIGGSGGMGAGSAPAPAPEPVAAGQTAAESFKNFATAGATQQAASWPSLGGNIDAGFQVEGAALNEALPTFTATMSGQMAPDAKGDGEVDAQRAEITDQVQGQTPTLPPVTPTNPGRFTGNASVGQSLSSLPAAATDDQKAQAGASAIRQIKTTDGTIATTPNPKPAIKLQGEQDPQRTERQRSEGMTQAQAAQVEAELAIRTGPGPEQVTLKELSEETEVPDIALGAISGTEQLPEFEEYLSLNLPADVQAKFDEAMAPGMDGAMSQAQAEFDAAATTRDTAHETEISRAQTEVERSNQEAQTAQEDAVRSARADITSEQQSTIQAQQKEISKVDSDARRKQSSDLSSIQSRVTQDGAKIDSEFQKAEQKAGQEVSKAEKSAADEKKAAEEKSKDRSWWQKAVDFVADAIKAVAQAVTAIFDAVRSLVATILDAAKAFANKIIEAAASFVKSVIKAFGEYLKSLVNNLLGSIFPGLARALCAFIDEAVELACEMVDHFADRLKETIAQVCDAINNTLKAISDTFNEAVNAALEIAKALATGNWQELLWMALEAALKLCGIDPGEFRSVMAQGEETISIIVKSPGQFVGNLIDAAALGFNNFKDHFVDHLKTGFVNWLTGQAGDAGITMPTTFDAGGIASLVMQVTGIDKEYVLEKAKKHIGAENVEKMQQVVGFVDTMWSGGLEGLANNLTEHLDGIYDEVVSKIQSFLMEKIVIAAVTKIATMFNPVGAIVQAVMTAWRLYEFMRDQISRIYGVVKSIIGSVHAIATGAIGGAAAQVESALSGMIPIAIDLLAKLIGVSGIGKKVREVLQALHKRIDDGIEKLIAKAKGLFKPKESKAKSGTQQGTQVQAGTNTATPGGAQTQAGAAPGTAQQSNANQGQATGGNGVDAANTGGNSQQGRGTTATPGSVTLVTPRLTVRDRDYGAIGMTMHGAARLKSSNDQPLDAGRQGSAQSRLTSALGSAAAARTAAVGVVGLSAQFGAIATEIKRGTSADLRSSNISVELVSVTSVELPPEVQQAIDAATAGQVTGASTPEAQQTELTSALEQRQGFTAGAESHSMWVATAGGVLTPMVASTPTPADQLLADWTGRLNTIADTTVRSETAAALRAAKGGITSLGRLLNNLWAMPDKHGARDKVKSLVWTKEAEVSAHIAKGFTAFGESAKPVDLNPRETLTSEFYATFKGRFIRISNSIGMGDPGGDAERIWLQTVSTILRTNSAYKAAPAVDPAGRYKDLGSDAMKSIISEFDPICDALAKYMSKQAAGASTFAFWSGKPGCSMAKANAQVALESSALGGLFDGLNIDGAWNTQLWGALSQAYAMHASNKVSGRRYLGFVGLGSSRDQSIFNKIEQPTFAGFFEEKALPVPDITFYACAVKVANIEEADHRFTGGGIKGTYEQGDRVSMVTLAEDKNKQRMDEYAAQKTASGSP